MTTFIRVHTCGSPFKNGQPMLINVDSIVRLYPDGAGSAIVLSDGNEIEVAEPFEKLAAQCPPVSA